MRNVPEPQRQFAMRSRTGAGTADGSSSRSYSSFGLTLATTLRARIVSPLSVTTPTALPFSTMISRTPTPVRISTPDAAADFAIACVIAPMPPMACPHAPLTPFTSPNT